MYSTDSLPWEPLRPHNLSSSSSAGAEAASTEQDPMLRFFGAMPVEEGTIVRAAVTDDPVDALLDDKVLADINLGVGGALMAMETEASHRQQQQQQQQQRQFFSRAGAGATTVADEQRVAQRRMAARQVQMERGRMAARQVQMIQRTMELQRMQQHGRGRGGGDDGSFIQYGGSDAGTLHRAPQRAASASVSQAAGRAAPPAARSAPQATGGSSASELAKAAADAATHFGYHSAIKSMFLKWKFPFVLYFLQRFAGLLKLSERCASDADRASGYTSSPIMIQLIDCLLGSSDGLTPRSIDPRKNPYIGRLRKWCEHIVSIAGGFECERFNAHHWRAVDERLQALFTACSVALRAEIFQRVRNACGGRGRLSAACVHVPFVPSIIAHPLPSSSLLRDPPTPAFFSAVCVPPTGLEFLRNSRLNADAPREVRRLFHVVLPRRNRFGERSTVDFPRIASRETSRKLHSKSQK